MLSLISKLENDFDKSGPTLNLELNGKRLEIKKSQPQA